MTILLVLLDVQVHISYHDYLITYDHCLTSCSFAICTEPYVIGRADIQNSSSHGIEHGRDSLNKQALLYLPVEVQADKSSKS